MDPLFTEMLQRLQGITAGCREDMHEPDEQGVAITSIVGTSLDNAMGESISERAITMGYQEVVLVLQREDSDKIIYEPFNLACLIALARKARVEDL